MKFLDEIISGLYKLKKKIPIFHPAYGMKRGEIKIHDGVIIEYLPDPLKKRKIVIAGIPEEYQPPFEINEIIEGNDAEKNARKDEHMKRYINWYINYIGRNLSLQKRKELEELYITSRAYSEKIIDEFTSEKINYKLLIDRMVESFSNVAQKERLIFSDNLSDLPSHNPLRIYKNSEITPQLIKKLGKIYKDHFNYYLDRSTWENIEISTPTIAKNVEYYKDDKAFYKYIPKDKNLLYQDLLREELGGSKKSITYGTTRTTGLPELLFYELRIYTAEHPGPSISDLPELKGLEGFNHVSVVAGVWLYQKRTVTVSGKTYTRYEENFSHWLIGNGCAGTYEKNDALILKQVKIFSGNKFGYEDLRKEAFGVMPVDGKYYPINACAYSVGTFFLDWVCQNNANAFTFRKWEICVVPPNYAGIEVYGTFGNKMISPRKCWCSPWKVRKGGVPGNRLHSNQVPHANLYISQIFEASAHGEGFGLDVYYNRKKNDWRKTEAKYRSKDIPFNGPSRSVTVEENWNDALVVRTADNNLKLYPFYDKTFQGYGIKVGTGFGSRYKHYFVVSNWKGDGNDALVVRTTDGDLMLYPYPFYDETFHGHGDKVGSGFGSRYTHYFIVSNWKGDGNDALVVRTTDGDLMLYPFYDETFNGHGDKVGSGFGSRYTHYFVVSNWKGDGNDALVVRTTDGDLMLYPFYDETFQGHGDKVGSGFGSRYTHYFVVSNWKGDGNDALVVRTTDGDLMLYPFYDETFNGHGINVGTGFGSRYTHYFVVSNLSSEGVDRPPFVIANCAEGLGLFDQECKDKKGIGYPVIDKQMLYEGNPTCKAIAMCGIQAHAGYYMIGFGDPEFEFDIDEYPIFYLTMKAEKDTDTCLLLMVHDKKPWDFMRRFVAIGKTHEGYRSCVSVGLGGKDCFTFEDDNKWHDYIYDLRKLRGKYPDAKTVRMVQFYSGKLCNGISRTVHFFHFSSLIFKSRR